MSPYIQFGYAEWIARLTRVSRGIGSFDGAAASVVILAPDYLPGLLCVGSKTYDMAVGERSSAKVRVNRFSEVVTSAIVSNGIATAQTLRFIMDRVKRLIIIVYSSQNFDNLLSTPLGKRGTGAPKRLKRAPCVSFSAGLKATCALTSA
jgi:hypothetical protein